MVNRYVRVKTPNLRVNMWSCEENNNVVKTSDGSTQFILKGETGYKDPNAPADYGTGRDAGAEVAAAGTESPDRGASEENVCHPARCRSVGHRKRSSIGASLATAYDRNADVELTGTIREFQCPRTRIPGCSSRSLTRPARWWTGVSGRGSRARCCVRASKCRPVEAGREGGGERPPLKDGRPAAILVSVTKADGSVWPDAALRRGPGGKPIETQ